MKPTLTDRYLAEEMDFSRRRLIYIARDQDPKHPEGFHRAWNRGARFAARQALRHLRRLRKAYKEWRQYERIVAHD